MIQDQDSAPYMERISIAGYYDIWGRQATDTNTSTKCKYKYSCKNICTALQDQDCVLFIVLLCNMVQVCWCVGRRGERNTKYKYRYCKIRRVQVIWRLGWVGWRSGKQDEEVQRLVALTSIDLQSPILFCISRFPFLILCIATIGGLIFYWFAVFLFCASVFLLWWVRGWEAVWEIGPYRFVCKMVESEDETAKQMFNLQCRPNIPNIAPIVTH